MVCVSFPVCISLLSHHSPRSRRSHTSCLASARDGERPLPLRGLPGGCGLSANLLTHPLSTAFFCLSCHTTFAWLSFASHVTPLTLFHGVPLPLMTYHLPSFYVVPLPRCTTTATRSTPPSAASCCAGCSTTSPSLPMSRTRWRRPCYTRARRTDRSPHTPHRQTCASSRTTRPRA